MLKTLILQPNACHKQTVGDSQLCCPRCILLWFCVAGLKVHQDM